MATCEKKTAAPIPPPVEYTLTLNEKEASLLHLLLRTVPGGSRAWLLREVAATLNRAKVPLADGRFTPRGWGADDIVLLLVAPRD